jgi:hypothetical protein
VDQIPVKNKEREDLFIKQLTVDEAKTCEFLPFSGINKGGSFFGWLMITSIEKVVEKKAGGLISRPVRPLPGFYLIYKKRV